MDGARYSVTPVRRITASRKSAPGQNPNPSSMPRTSAFASCGHAVAYALARASEHLRWQVEAKRPRGLHIDDELVFGRRLHWQIGRLLPFKDRSAGFSPLRIRAAAQPRLTRKRKDAAPARDPVSACLKRVPKPICEPGHTRLAASWATPVWKQQHRPPLGTIQCRL